MSSADWPVRVAGVGAILRSRTRDTSGTEIGTFDDTTRPTEDQVLSLINEAVLGLVSAVGDDIPEQFWQQAGSVATYKTCMLVELSYFPEQIVAGRSLYDPLKELHKEALDGLRAALNEYGKNVPGEASGAPSPPSYSFPLGSTLDVVLGPLPGGYGIPYGGGLFQ